MKVQPVRRSIDFAKKIVLSLLLKRTGLLLNMSIPPDQNDQLGSFVCVYSIRYFTSSYRFMIRDY